MYEIVHSVQKKQVHAKNFISYRCVFTDKLKGIGEAI